jgi:hypothetical protein
MKKTIFLAIALLLAISASAERRTIKDCTENWLQGETAEETTSSDNLRIGPAPEAPTVPVGEGLLVLTALAGLYGFTRRKRKISY